MAVPEKFAEEDAQGFRFEVTGRNFVVTDSMKEHIKQKLSKILRFDTHMLDVHVVLEIQKIENFASVVVKFAHTKIKVSAMSTDMYVSIDKVIDRLNTMMSRWKERIQDHQRRATKDIDMTVNVVRRPYNELEEINKDIERANKESDSGAPHQVIKNEKRPLKSLTSDEALWKMEMSGDRFLVFRGEEDRKLKVIYLRDDGHYGIILAE